MRKLLHISKVNEVIEVDEAFKIEEAITIKSEKVVSCSIYSFFKSKLMVDPLEKKERLARKENNRLRA